MAYHIAFNRPIDLSSITHRAEQGLNPRHSMAALADRLKAQTHDGTGLNPTLKDRALGKISRTAPLWWAIARKLQREAASGDVIYCVGEDIGVPVAALCGGHGVKVVMTTHFIARSKGRLALRLLNLQRRTALFTTVARPQADFLRSYLGPQSDRVLFIWDQTDTEFFTAGPASPNKARPVIMSVGLEQRDYGTLAKATEGLDVDVRISGYSADTRVLSRAFPDAMPENMTRRFYPWPELLQLYRDADVVVVSLFPNRHAAGVQAVMEALSCGRPVVVTATEGLSGYLDEADAVRLIPPGDPDRMREAIMSLLSDPERSTRMGKRAASLAREKHRLEHYVETLAAALERLANPGSVDVTGRASSGRSQTFESSAPPAVR